MKVLFCLALSFFVFSSYAKKRFIVHYKKDKSLNLKSGRVSMQTSRLKKREIKRLNQLELSTLKEDSSVDFIEEDILLEPVGINSPNQNSYYSYQWNLHDSTGGISIEDVWQEEVGHSDLTIAVIDTGILNHSDISARVIAGADFISDTSVSNDGDGRDMDASDPGDWVESGDSCYKGSFRSSTWHGSHVAGIIGAINNSKGVVGINLNSKIMPIRALGKCGGYLSDVADAIRWAAGDHIDGLNDNPSPAQVINLSLGGEGACTQTMQNAIDFARSQGAVVVAAAGNSQLNLNETPFTPASCSGVIVVAASNDAQFASGYTNYGDAVDIYAPGGDSYAPVYSLSNTGSTSPGSDAYVGMSGTSMAAPHISAIVSLMMSANPQLYPYQIEDVLRQSSNSDICANGPCRGFVNATGAISLAKTTSADEKFVGYEPVAPNPGNGGSSNPSFKTTGSGAACGSIGGTKSNRDSFFRTVILGALLAASLSTLTSAVRKGFVI